MRVLKLMVLGAVSFWLPDTIWDALRGSNFDGRDATSISLLMPLTLLVAYVLIKIKRLYYSESRKPVGWPMMLGVWLLGGFFIVAGEIVAGPAPGGLSGALTMILLSSFPPAMIDISTYDGSLLALLIASLGALPIWLVARWLAANS